MLVRARASEYYQKPPECSLIQGVFPYKAQAKWVPKLKLTILPFTIPNRFKLSSYGRHPTHRYFFNSRLGSVLFIVLLLLNSSHIRHPGHVRSLVAFACRIVKQNASIGVTILAGGDIVKKTETEKGRYFAPDDQLKDNVRYVILDMIVLAYCPLIYHQLYQCSKTEHQYV